MSLRHFFAITGAIACLAAASDPAETLRNPRQEAAARNLFRETRCLVCQGESIDDSDAELARDLRQFIRRQVASGASDAQVRQTLVARYGEFVLFRPPLTWGNSVLWLGPFAVAVVGAGLFFAFRSRATPTPTLTPDEEDRLLALGPNPDS